MALDVHLRVLRRKIEESDWTHDDIRDQTGWSRAYLFAILHRLRPLRVEDLFAVLEAIDVDPGVYFEEVCRELAEIDGD